MADEKKPAGDKPAPPKADPFVDIIWVIFAILIAVYALNGILSFFNSNNINGSSWRDFTPRGLLLKTTRPISSLENPINSKFVVTSYKADVLNSPGGKKISTVRLGDKGTIMEGPAIVSGEKFWQVKFENGDEGWVSENDLSYGEEKSESLFIKLVIFFWKFLSFVKIFVIILVLVFMVFTFVLVRKLTELRKVEREKIYPSPFVENSLESAPLVNAQWETIVRHSESLNENDWRQAIIEADIILGDLLEKMSLHGETIGDKLKSVEPSDFSTLNNAWEAHKIRNNIAHEGMSYLLSHREVKRVIGLYRSVFDEFRII